MLVNSNFVSSLLVILTGFFNFSTHVCPPFMPPNHSLYHPASSFTIWLFVIFVEKDVATFLSCHLHRVKNVSVRLFHFFRTTALFYFDLSDDLGKDFDFSSRGVLHLDFPFACLGSDIEVVNVSALVEALCECSN